LTGYLGVDKSIFMHHEDDPSLEDVKAVINAIPPDQYIPELWDCEDRALYAISRVRCMHPCMPIGLAIGQLTDQTIIKGKHALVILWDKDFTKYEFYDPALKQPIGFNPDLIIPMPSYGNRIADNIPGTGGLPPITYKSSAIFQFDGRYDFSDKMIKAAKTFLVSGGVGLCRGSRCPQFIESYHSYDKVLFWFINMRKEDDLKGCPIGVAFGKWKNSFPQALMVFWETPRKLSYWTMTAGKLSQSQEKKFKLDFIIV